MASSLHSVTRGGRGNYARTRRGRRGVKTESHSDWRVYCQAAFMKSIRISTGGKLIVSLAFISIVLAVSAAEGRIIEESFHSKALEGNILGDSPKRDVFVYLPPSYDKEKKRRYPTVYLLHGNSRVTRGEYNPATSWINGGIRSTMNSLIKTEKVREMILVMPNGRNRYGGSHYVNSPVTGNWADHIAHDLVQFVDGKFRTLRNRNSRALTGSSMGGRGTLILGMNYPDVFGVIYAMSSGSMNFGELPLQPRDAAGWKKLLRLNKLDDAERSMIRTIGLSAAFSPNPDRPPFYVDFKYQLVDGELVAIQEVQKRWHQFDPVMMMDLHKARLIKLKGFKFDCGRFDTRTLDANRALAKKLKAVGIPHIYEEYDGGHGDKRLERIEESVLPFFSEALDFGPE